MTEQAYDGFCHCGHRASSHNGACERCTCTTFHHHHGLMQPWPKPKAAESQGDGA